MRMNFILALRVAGSLYFRPFIRSAFLLAEAALGQWPKKLVSSLKSPLYLSVGPRKSLVSCRIALILVLSLRPRLPLLGECSEKGGWGGCFVCGVKRHAVCVLCFSDSSVFLCDNALAVRSPLSWRCALPTHLLFGLF